MCPRVVGWGGPSEGAWKTEAEAKSKSEMRGLSTPLRSSPEDDGFWGGEPAKWSGYGLPGPEVVEVEDTLDLAFGVDYDQGGDFFGFHDGGGVGGEGAASMVTGGVRGWAAVWSKRARLPPSRSRRRRRTPSEIMPRSFLFWRTVVMPSFLRDIS